MNEYEKFLRRQDLFGRAATLESQIVEGMPLTTKQAKEYEAIDFMRVKGMKHAEKKCRKLKLGFYECSPQLEKAADTKQLWYLLSERMQGRRI